MILKFTGTYVDIDRSATSYSDTPLAGTIGGVDFLEEIVDACFGGPVTVALADERFTGDLEVWGGIHGWSEWTPEDPATLNVGEHRVLDRLRALDGQQVTLWVADEPINTLEDTPSPDS